MEALSQQNPSRTRTDRSQQTDTSTGTVITKFCIYKIFQRFIYRRELIFCCHRDAFIAKKRNNGRDRELGCNSAPAAPWVQDGDCRLTLCLWCTERCSGPPPTSCAKHVLVIYGQPDLRAGEQQFPLTITAFWGVQQVSKRSSNKWLVVFRRRI